MSKSKSKSGSGSGSIPALSGAWPSQHRNSTVGPPGFSCPNPSRGPLDTDTDTDTDTEPELACFAIDRFEHPLAGNGYPRQKYGSRRCPIPPPWPWPGRKRHRASAPLREDLRMGKPQRSQRTQRRKQVISNLILPRPNCGASRRWHKEDPLCELCALCG